jgi:hypothetical protein
MERRKEYQVTLEEGLALLFESRRRIDYSAKMLNNESCGLAAMVK